MTARSGHDFGRDRDSGVIRGDGRAVRFGPTSGGESLRSRLVGLDGGGGLGSGYEGRGPWIPKHIQRIESGRQKAVGAGRCIAQGLQGFDSRRGRVGVVGGEGDGGLPVRLALVDGSG